MRKRHRVSTSPLHAKTNFLRMCQGAATGTPKATCRHGRGTATFKGALVHSEYSGLEQLNLAMARRWGRVIRLRVPRLRPSHSGQLQMIVHT
mgnify:CR=1 FL=1